MLESSRPATMEEPRRRLTREESRTQTRERLIESAYQLFSTEGIEPASIDRIAEHAGYSRGAFYSNFQTKEDLLAAVVEREWKRSEAEFAALAAREDRTPEEIVAGLREYALASTSDYGQCMFYMELQMYGVRHPEARAIVSYLVQRDTRVAGTFLDKLFEKCGVTNHPPSELIVGGFIAMAQGLTMRQVVEPDALPPGMLRDALGLYFDSVITACIPSLRK
jgi:AcrR family transcriptional regulator